MSGLLSDIARGSIAGAVGTAAMTLVMGVGRAVGGFGAQAPAEIISNVETRAGVREQLPEEAFTASWLAFHVGYGAAWGGIYSALRPLLPSSPLGSGLLFGLGLWTFSYLGLMPALGIYPLPCEDYRSRVATMIAAHMVYGITTAEFARSS